MLFGAISDPLEWAQWPAAAELLGPEVAEIPGLGDGSATLWCAVEDGKVIAALVTELIDTPQGRECFLRLVGGAGRERWLHYLDDAVIPWARLQGCTAIEGTMRIGWERVFKDWKRAAVVLRREI